MRNSKPILLITLFVVVLLVSSCRPAQVVECDGYERVCVDGEACVNNRCVPVVNVPPVVSAGEDFDVVVGEEFELGGVASDPDDYPKSLTSQWSRVSGPGDVTFQNYLDTKTKAVFDNEGIYVIELSAYDGEYRVNDTASVTVNSYSVNDSCTLNNFGSNLNPTGEPVGGGENYSNIINPSDADFIVSTRNELVYALSNATSGDIIYVDDAAQINLSNDRNSLYIPAGVTLASGRGRDGSKGGLLYSDYIIKTDGTWAGYWMLRPSGNNVRITGLRLKGPDTFVAQYENEYSKYQGISDYTYSIEVDNSELYYFGSAAVYVADGGNAHVHHNYIHNNTRAGIGYGVVISGASNSLIEANIFDFNRHSIAGSGNPGQNYTARYNIQTENSLQQGFDMHGGFDRGDGTDIAGERVEIYGNTFYSLTDKNYAPADRLKGVANSPAIIIRGVPEDGAYIHDNYFFYESVDSEENFLFYGANPDLPYLPTAVRQEFDYGGMHVYDNCFNGELK